MSTSSMSTDTPVIIEVAVNGVTTKERNPPVPDSPEALPPDALRRPDEGAAIVPTPTTVGGRATAEAPAENAEGCRPVRAGLCQQPGRHPLHDGRLSPRAPRPQLRRVRARVHAHGARLPPGRPAGGRVVEQVLLFGRWVLHDRRHTRLLGAAHPRGARA